MTQEEIEATSQKEEEKIQEVQEEFQDETEIV